MAACGGLRMYEKPLPLESHPPWKHVKSIKTVDHYSFIELFGELHLKENNYVVDSIESSASSSPSSSLTSISPFTNDENAIASENLSTCTEELGFDSSDDFDQDSHNYDWQPQEDKVRTRYSRCGSIKYSRRNKGSFPPPISCIGRNGKPWVCFKSVREDGRFILTEIRVPTKECLHAWRKNGRLKMQFGQSDVDEDEEENSEEDDEGTSEIEDGDAEGTRM